MPIHDEVFESAISIARPAAAVYDWHLQPGAFLRLQPPWERVELIGGHPGVTNGSHVRVCSRVGPFKTEFLVEHREVQAGRQFHDVMLSGPFARWEHRHIFEATGAGSCRLVDRITYRLPGGAVGRFLGADFVRRKLARMFAYRQSVTKADLETVPAGCKPLTVLVTGASGLVGRNLIPFLQTQGHAVRQLVRRAPVSAGEIHWNPATGELDARQLEGIDAVVHLSGENIADGRWTPARQLALRRSRLDSTRTLVSALAGMTRPPRVLVSASAVGLYGDCGDATVNESQLPGAGFLAELCREWEAELVPARAAGIRTVALRTGVVLTPAGGALAKMLPAFRAGVGGRLGSGRQWMSWIAFDDLLGAIHHILHQPDCDGPVNAVAPSPVTNAYFTSTLGAVVNRPAAFPVPACVLRALFGRMADEALLGSTRAVPGVLQRTGYVFRFPQLEPALRHGLGAQRVRLRGW